MIRYCDATGTERLVLEDGVIRHFAHHQQETPNCREAGGQLFARFDRGNAARIVRATGPRWSDRRGRFYFCPNRWAERREILRLFRDGEHFVGDWHTHPEDHPTPSGTDITSIQDMFRRSRHSLGAFVMVIVGIGRLPNGLFVALANAGTISELRAVRNATDSVNTVGARSRACVGNFRPGRALGCHDWSLTGQARRVDCTKGEK